MTGTQRRTQQNLVVGSMAAESPEFSLDVARNAGDALDIEPERVGEKVQTETIRTLPRLQKAQSNCRTYMASTPENKPVVASPTSFGSPRPQVIPSQYS